MFIVTVDIDKCEACGDCVDICPRDLFSLQPASHRLWVACKNLEKGDLAEAECVVACNGCAWRAGHHGQQPGRDRLRPERPRLARRDRALSHRRHRMAGRGRAQGPGSGQDRQKGGASPEMMNIRKFPESEPCLIIFV